MTNTERKYHEAKYFFQRLDIDDPYFDFNLSAFLNAARSIAWIMRHEFNKTAGWDQWFKQYDVSETGRTLLYQINELRIEATKKSGVKTDFFFLQSDLFVAEKYYPDLEKLKALEDGEYIFSIEPVGESKETDDTNAEGVRFIAEINRTNRPYDAAREKLKELCKEYLLFMDELVKACISKFTLANS